MHTYQISTGRWTLPDGTFFVGYSGYDPDPTRKDEPGEGKNDPSDQRVRSVGPIPVGRYKIGLPHFHPTTGPYTLRLHPQPGTETFGRSGFLCHGEGKNPGQSSHGCVVAPRVDRMRIGESGDEDLEVVV